MIIRTVQTFIMTYDVPEIEVYRFNEAIETGEGSVLEAYEVNQEYIGEQRIPN